MEGVASLVSSIVLLLPAKLKSLTEFSVHRITVFWVRLQSKLSLFEHHFSYRIVFGIFESFFNVLMFRMTKITYVLNWKNWLSILWTPQRLYTGLIITRIYLEKIIIFSVGKKHEKLFARDVLRSFLSLYVFMLKLCAHKAVSALFTRFSFSDDIYIEFISIE